MSRTFLHSYMGSYQRAVYGNSTKSKTHFNKGIKNRPILKQKALFFNKKLNSF